MAKGKRAKGGNCSFVFVLNGLFSRINEPNKEFTPKVQEEIDARLAEITAQLAKVAPDLQSINRHRYAWQMRCLDELVEALSLAHYLRHQTLITRGEAQARVPEAVPLTHLDYLWGVFDLSGEMMRFATVATARTGRMAGGVGGRSILGDLQELRYRLETLPEIPTKEYRGKMEVMRQSVQKVEKLGYGLVVRGSERPRGWLPDMKDDAAGAVEPV